MRRNQLAQQGVFALTVVALLATLGLVVWPLIAAAGSDGGPGYDPAKISDYTVAMTVSEDGRLEATETITTDMPSGRHGIFRYFDVADAADPRGRAIPRDVEILQDGQPAEVDWSWESGRRYKVAKIGDADTTLTEGPHVYVITYAIDGVLAEPGTRFDSGSWASQGGSEFVWDVVPGGWSMPIAKSTITVTLPSEPVAAPHCAIRYAPDCTVAVSDRTITVTTGPLGTQTPVSLAVQVDEEPAAGTLLPWPAWLDPVFGRNLVLALGLLVAAAVAFVVGRLIERRTREAAPGFPVLFEPPAGLGPVQTAYITEEKLPANAVSATMLHLAEKGFVQLDHAGSNRWAVTGLRDGREWLELDSLSRSVGTALGVDQLGQTFAVDGSVASGKVLSSLSTSLPKTARSWAVEAGLLEHTASVPAARILLVVSAVLAVGAAWLQPFGTGLVALVPAAFVVGAIGLIRVSATTHRTAAGRDAWSRAGGFRRMLATDSAESRFDFAARKDLYTAYIPFAVAFGCADAWAAKYQAATGSAAPVPVWYAGGLSSPGHSGTFGALNFASFDAALASSISAYAATQRSSSSGGGGGFSGGGGGGGGGGGSW